MQGSREEDGRNTKSNFDIAKTHAKLIEESMQPLEE